MPWKTNPSAGTSSRRDTYVHIERDTHIYVYIRHGRRIALEVKVLKRETYTERERDTYIYIYIYIDIYTCIYIYTSRTPIPSASKFSQKKNMCLCIQRYPFICKLSIY